jgi:hypothetical protein
VACGWPARAWRLFVAVSHRFLISPCARFFCRYLYHPSLALLYHLPGAPPILSFVIAFQHQRQIMNGTVSLYKAWFFALGVTAWLLAAGAERCYWRTASAFAALMRLIAAVADGFMADCALAMWRSGILAFFAPCCSV